MSKALKNSNLSQRSSVRSLLAISLTLSLATFGCTTDRTLGNGDPVTTPGVRTSPTGGSSIGSESTTSGQTSLQSMTSSSSARFDALPVVTPRGRLTHAQAAAIMAQYQSAPRVRVLGPAMPGDAGRPYASDGVVTGQFINPALITNPQVTVNSSISSTATPVVISGAGGDGGGAGVGINGAVSLGGSPTGGVATTTTANAGLGVGGNANTTGVTAPATFAADDAAAPLFSTTPVSPTASAAATVPPGAFAAGTGSLTPTAAAAINPGVTAASNFGRTLPTATAARNTGNAGLTVGGNANTTGTTVTGATNVTANATTATTTNNTTAAGINAARRTSTNAGVRIITDANGRRTVTNQ